jgi:hypothetical protein
VIAFRGDRSRAFVATFLGALRSERAGLGPGPTGLDCLLYSGHTGVSADGGAAIYGFTPDGNGVPVSQLMDRLRNGEAFPGLVRDDAAVFTTAQNRGLTLVSFDVILPDPQFQAFTRALDAERQKSQYSYGFPNGDGDCNCTTWLERLGLPLLTGHMNEFIGLAGLSSPSRRFGRCV